MVGTKYSRKRSASDILRPFRGRVLALCVSTVASSLLQVSIALVTRDLVDCAVQSGERLFFWGAILFINLLLLVILHTVYGWLGGSTADRCVAQLRKALLQQAVYSEDDLKYHSGSVMSRAMEDVRTLCDGMVNVIPTIVGQLVRLIASFAVIIFLFPSVIWAIALGAGVVVLGAVIVRPILKKHHAAVRTADEQVLTAMQEDLQNLELVKGLGAEKQVLHRFDQRIRYFLKTHTARRVVTVGRNTAISVISQLGTGALLLWGAFQVANQGMSYGMLAAMLQLISLLRNPVFGLSGLLTRLSSVEVAEERLSQILTEDTPEAAPADISRVYSIVFEEVTFLYPEEEVPVLEDFSAQFDLNRWVCMTGMSGKGKTTLFKLILGLYKPQKGRVYLLTDKGEVPCSAHTRHLFSYVPQNYALLSGSVLDNLLLAAPDADSEQIARALRLAQADFVWELPAKENTHVRENNAGLSMGQLQRLAAARAILMDRPVFLLDECTSALDAPTEGALLQALFRLDKQGILVTHRPEALQAVPANEISMRSI